MRFAPGCFLNANFFAPHKKTSGMHPFLEELIPLQGVHAHFANWERAKHRAEFFATIAFPDSHPMRRLLIDMGRDLDDHRWAADLTIHDIRKRYGDFRTCVNGYFFEDSGEWFEYGRDIYFDCPKISFGRGVRRSHELYLAGVASLHDLETCGKRFATAVNCLVDTVRPKAKGNLLKRTKLFEKDCRRLERQLHRVKVCPRDRMHVLLCLGRKGVPGPVGTVVLKYLV